MKKDPRYKIRYSSGLGDVVTCLLHSKYLKGIVKIITKSEEQCESCNQRAYFLNLFFPIPIWKFYYKTMDERFLAFKSDMENYGYVFDKHVKKEENEEKTCNCNCKNQQVTETNPLNPLRIDYIEYDGYVLSSKHESDENGYKIVKFTYKKI
jgi:hypothetical protein